MQNTTEINFKKLVTHDLSKEKSARITTNNIVDSSSSLVLFNPLKSFKKRWDLVMSVLLAFNLMVIPFTVGFSMSEGTGTAIFWINRAIDGLFIADIFISFETGIYAGEKILMQRSTVRQVYATGWFPLDLVSSIPLDVLVSLFLIDSVGSDKLLSIDGPRLYDTFTLVQFFKLFRLLKLFKTIAIFQNFEKALVYRYDDLGILRFLLFIFFTLHWSACIFAWLDENICLQADEYSVFVDTGLEDEDRATKYIAALYWALATMTTIGYGDISAQCSATQVFSLIVMLLASVVYAYGLSYVMEVMRNKRKAQSEFRELMDLVNKYMVFRKIPKDLREEIRKFFNYISESDAKKNDLLSERIILEELSPELRVAVLCHVNSGLLEKVPLFNQIQEYIGQSRSILQEMVMHMRSQVFRPLEAVLKEGNPGNEIFFVTSGTCVQIKWNTITVNVITEGEYYGEAGFLFSAFHHTKSSMFDMNDMNRERDSVVSHTRGFASTGELFSHLTDGKTQGPFSGMELAPLTDRSSMESAVSHASSTNFSSKPDFLPGPMGKRHTYAAVSTPTTSDNDHLRTQQRNSTTIGVASALKESIQSTPELLRPAQNYAQRYSLVTQSYADLRYITRELFDEVVKSLPRSKLLKVNRLMHKRYQEILLEDENREAELERLYPQIKAEFVLLHTIDVEEDEDEIDWRKQDFDFVEEEVNEGGLDIHVHEPSKQMGRRGSQQPQSAQRRPSSLTRRKSVSTPSINQLMSPRKKPQPLNSSSADRRKSSPAVTTPHAGKKGLPPSHPLPSRFNFDSESFEGFPHPSDDKKRTEHIKKSFSSCLGSPSRGGGSKKTLHRGSSGVLGSHNNSISSVIKSEHFVTATPNIFQSSVPTISVVQASHNRFFERAMSMAGTTPLDISSSDDSSVDSLQSFSDELGLSDMDDNTPINGSNKLRNNSIGLMKQNSSGSSTGAPLSLQGNLESLETIEKSLSSLFNHVSQLKRDLSVKQLGALAEEDEDEEDEGEEDDSNGDTISDIGDHSGLENSVVSDIGDKSGLSQDDSTSENQFESLDLNVAIPTELSEVELDANVTKRNHVPCMGSLSPPRPDKPKLTIQTEYL